MVEMIMYGQKSQFYQSAVTEYANEFQIIASKVGKSVIMDVKGTMFTECCL